MLIVVFDPLAVALTLAINMVILTHKTKDVPVPAIASTPRHVDPLIPTEVPQPPPAKWDWSPTWQSKTTQETVVTESETPPPQRTVEETKVDEALADLDVVLEKLEKATVKPKVEQPVPEPAAVVEELIATEVPVMAEEPTPESVVEEPVPTISTIEQLKETYSEPDPIVLSSDDLVTAKNMPTSQPTTVVARPTIRRLFSGPVKPEDDIPKK